MTYDANNWFAWCTIRKLWCWFEFSFIDHALSHALIHFSFEFWLNFLSLWTSGGQSTLSGSSFVEMWGFFFCWSFGLSFFIIDDGQWQWFLDNAETFPMNERCWQHNRMISSDCWISYYHNSFNSWQHIICALLPCDWMESAHFGQSS